MVYGAEGEVYWVGSFAVRWIPKLAKRGWREKEPTVGADGGVTVSVKVTLEDRSLQVYAQDNIRGRVGVVYKQAGGSEQRVNFKWYNLRLWL